jgi:homoserine O-acetyltransferase
MTVLSSRPTLAYATRRARGDFESVSPATSFVDLPRVFTMHRGGVLRDGVVAYETFGSLSADRDNAVLVLPGLSASAHVASTDGDPRSGWWESMVGPGRPIDTDEWFVICVSALGGCRGSSGPASIDPKTGRPYGVTFPELALEDVAEAAAHVVRALEIDQLACVVGTSMGGMVALALLERWPSLARAHVNISAGLHSMPFAIAMRSVQREAIRDDPSWQGGDYTATRYPASGMRTARKLGVLTYRSSEEWSHRFARRRVDHRAEPFGREFEVESYVHANADRFSRSFDPNCYLYLSRAVDWFEAGQGVRGGPADALVMGVRTDLLFPPEQQQDVADYFRRRGAAVRHVVIDSDKGHDAFLVDVEAFGRPLSSFLNNRPWRIG